MPTVLEVNDGVPVTLGVAVHLRRRTASSPASASTRRRATPAPTSGPCGPRTATSWRPGRSPTSRASGWQTADLRHAGDAIAQEHALRRVLPRHRRGATRPRLNAFAARDLSRAPLRVTLDGGCLHLRHRLPGRPVQRPTTWSTWSSTRRRRASRSTSQSPAPGALDVPRTSKVVVDFSDPVEPGWSLTRRVRRCPRGHGRRSRPTATAHVDAVGQPMPAGADVTVTLAGVTTADGATLRHADLDVPHPVGRDAAEPDAPR